MRINSSNAIIDKQETYIRLCSTVIIPANHVFINQNHFLNILCIVFV